MSRRKYAHIEVIDPLPSAVVVFSFFLNISLLKGYNDEISRKELQTIDNKNMPKIKC